MAMTRSNARDDQMDRALYENEYRYALLQVAGGKYGSAFSALTESQKKEAQDIALKQCEIQRRILASDESSKVVIPSERLQQEIETVISRYADREGFEQELMDNGLSSDDFPSLVERALKVEAVMDFVASKAEPCSEINARLYYYMHPEKFKQPELRTARHILITINEDFPENRREEVIKRATVIAKRLQNKPSRFAEQAQKNSECPTAMNGGELGVLKRGVLFPSLDKALFAMKVGEVSDIIESPMGFHILFCEEIQKEGYISVSKVLPDIVDKLNERNRTSYQRKWLKELFDVR